MSNAIRVVYVGGPFSGSCTWEIEGNVRRAEALALEVAKLGAMPLCPHTNSRFFHGVDLSLPIPASRFWYAGTMELLRRSDAMIVVPDWERSTGTHDEVNDCRTSGRPVFFDLDALRVWLKGQAEK